MGNRIDPTPYNQAKVSRTNKFWNKVDVLRDFPKKGPFFAKGKSMNMTGNEIVTAASIIGYSWKD